MVGTLAVVGFTAETVPPVADRLLVAPAPPAALLNPAFTVQARCAGGTWQDVAVYTTRVGLREMSQVAFASFDFSGRVELSITRTAGEFTTLAIRPAAAAQLVSHNGATALLVVDHPGQCSFEVDGDRAHNLHLFANPLEEQVPQPGDPGVLYFAPGVHAVGNDPLLTSEGDIGGLPRAVLKVASGQTVYLAPGSVVQAAVKVEDHAKQVVIRGRGIIDLSPWNEPDGRFKKGHTYQTPAINLPRTSGVRIEGIIIKQPTGYAICGGNAEDVTIDNVKSFSSHLWADGIDMMSSSHITIRRIFIRNSDDGIAIYGSRFSFHGDSTAWTVSDAVLWADCAHPIYLGVHGDYQGKGDTIADITFHNIDILESNEQNQGYWGALSIGCGDRNTCRDITFSDIRVDHIRDAGGRLIDLQFKHFPPSTIDGSAISGITFRNLVYNGPMGSLIAGRSETQRITGVVFDHVVINGRQVAAPSDGGVVVGPFVSGVEWR